MVDFAVTSSGARNVSFALRVVLKERLWSLFDVLCSFSEEKSSATQSDLNGFQYRSCFGSGLACFCDTAGLLERVRVSSWCDA